jgi:D-amino-acid dehydrogenase
MYDVIVVGGGVVGLSTAYHLVKAGAKTLLVDRDDVGRATSAGAGIISPETNARDQDAAVNLGIEAGAYYRELMADLGEAAARQAGYARCGLLLVAATEDEVEAYQRAHSLILDRQGQRGSPSETNLHEISPSEAKTLFPPLADVYHALYHRHAARVDGRRLSMVLRRASEAQGLIVRIASVERLVLSDSRVNGVMIDGEMVASPRVIIAGGAWSPWFGAQLGLDLPVAPQRGQIIHLSLGGVDTSFWPVVNAFHGHYMVPWDDSRVVVGATRETGSGFAPQTTVTGVQEVLREALRVAPGLADASIQDIRVGLRPLSTDGMPILGTVPGVQGVYLATGHGPSGLTLGPLSGKLVAELALTGAASADLSPFSAMRFPK